jgi:hypothetical protein
MSINNFTEVQGFSISGLQNITADTINGNTVLTTITIAGQTAFLSYDSTTSTLTLLIPTSDGVVSVGLLSATDWNTFNGKESPLTFTSPLTRGGNTITFDFSTANTFTGVNTFSNLVNFNSNIQLNALPLATTSNILYIDGTGLVSYAAAPVFTDLLPLNNIWTGATNRFQNALVVENENNSTYQLIVYRSQLSFPDFTYMNNAGKMGYFDGTDKWTIDRFGQFVGGSVIVNDFIQATNNIETTGGDFVGLGLNIIGSSIFFQNPNVTTNNYYTVNYDTGSKQLSVAPSVLGTSNTFASANTFVEDLTSTKRFLATNTTFRNSLRFTHFEPTPAINNWISAEFSYDAIDKPIVGNLGLVVGGYGPTFGGHNTTLTGWATCWVNPFSLTICNDLTVNGTFTPPSDRRLKDEIRYLDAGKSIDFIKRLKPCIYRRCDPINDPYVKNEDQPRRKLQHGFIADEVEQVAQTEAQRNLVDTFEFNGYKDCRKLAILNLIPEIVQANKEMIDKIERLETENKLLQERLLKIENLIAKKKCLAFI